MIDLPELAQRESERVEWKENVANINNVIKTIVAFANDYSNLGGGYVVCGVKEIKDEHGFPKLDRTGLTSERLKKIEQEILAKCREKIDPPLVPLTELLETSDQSRRILVFIIPASQKIHSFRTDKDSSKYYIRSGQNTIEARNGLLRELLVKKNAVEPWDRRICHTSKIEDIDLYLFRDLLQELHLWAPEKPLEDYISETDSIHALLPPLTGKTPLDNTLKLRNFSILMFGKNPQKFIPGAYSIFSIYKGKSRSEPTAERYEITGPIVQQTKKLFELLNTESYTAFDKTSPVPNQNKYPVRALQEAVVNALVHREYESYQPTRITVFSDRIEINSPGILPRAVDKNKFLQGKATPFWRNQTLAFFFNKLQLAQGEGQGIPTILRLMKEEGCPDPIFEFGTENVIYTLPAHLRHELIKELSSIEHKIILGNYIEAVERLTTILEKDIYNYRALELFCEVHNLLQKPEIVLNFVIKNRLDYKKINPGTLVLLSETMGLIKNNSQARRIAHDFLDYAIEGHLEEKQIIIVARNLRKMGLDEKAIDFINESFRKYPNLSENSDLLETLARGKIDLAKQCIKTGKNKSTGRNLKTKAWDRCRQYLKEAESALLKAFDNAINPISKEYIQQDIEFLYKMKEKSQKPGPRKDQSANKIKKETDKPKKAQK